MKNIGIITWSSWHNFGTFLQAYALQMKIASLGYECKIIDDEAIIKDRFNWKWELKKLIKCASSQYRSFHKCQRRISNNYRKFKHDYMAIDKDVASKAALSSRYDGFVCGSDQIWSVALVSDDQNWFYYANFTHKPKIAYSPSLGASFISEDKVEIYRNLLSEFKSISIREPQGQKAIQALTNKKVELTVDPTLLISQRDWLRITPPRIKVN